MKILQTLTGKKRVIGATPSSKAQLITNYITKGLNYITKGIKQKKVEVEITKAPKNFNFLRNMQSFTVWQIFTS